MSALLGAGDQWVGSWSWHPWATDVSLLSAPWLVLAFLAGCTQRDSRHAAIVGLASTLTALIGYGAMTLSPIEGAHLSLSSVLAFVRSESPVIVGGVITGPLFGWFGQQWRSRRAWLGALITAAAVCAEPLVRVQAGHEVRLRAVWLTEVAAGLAMAGYVAVARARRPPAR